MGAIIYPLSVASSLISKTVNTVGYCANEDAFFLQASYALSLLLAMQFDTSSLETTSSIGCLWFLLWIV